MEQENKAGQNTCCRENGEGFGCCNPIENQNHPFAKMIDDICTKHDISSKNENYAVIVDSCKEIFLAELAISKLQVIFFEIKQYLPFISKLFDNFEQNDTNMDMVKDLFEKFKDKMNNAEKDSKMEDNV